MSALHNIPRALHRRSTTAALAACLLLGTSPALAAVTLLASAARTASGTAAISVDASRLDAAICFLDVTAAATETADKLDVYLQHSWDGGTTYTDLAHFTQADGDGGAVSYLVTWSRLPTPEDEEHAEGDASLAEASVLQGPAGAQWRAKWVVTDAATDNASFTFSLVCEWHYKR